MRKPKLRDPHQLRLALTAHGAPRPSSVAAAEATRRYRCARDCARLEPWQCIERAARAAATRLELEYLKRWSPHRIVGERPCQRAAALAGAWRDLADVLLKLEWAGCDVARGGMSIAAAWMMDAWPQSEVATAALQLFRNGAAASRTPAHDTRAHQNRGALR